MGKTTTYVGLDVHKDTIVVALAEMGIRGEVREYGKITHTSAALKTLTTKLASRHGDLRFCYEAGPCGYGIQRQLAGLGHECVVVAPSLIPRKPGERVKTDRRDAGKLATLHRAGELTPVWFRIRRTRRCVISCVLGRRRCVACVRHANNCPVSCFGMAITASDLPGRRRIGAGCPASSSTNLSII